MVGCAVIPDTVEIHNSGGRFRDNEVDSPTCKGAAMLNQLNWTQLLQRVHDNAALLDQLTQIDARYRLAFDGVCAVLLESGFSLPEAQEIYTLLRV